MSVNQNKPDKNKRNARVYSLLGLLIQRIPGNNNTDGGQIMRTIQILARKVLMPVLVLSAIITPAAAAKILPLSDVLVPFIEYFLPLVLTILVIMIAGHLLGISVDTIKSRSVQIGFEGLAQLAGAVVFAFVIFICWKELINYALGALGYTL